METGKDVQYSLLVGLKQAFMDNGLLVLAAFVQGRFSLHGKTAEIPEWVYDRSSMPDSGIAAFAERIVVIMVGTSKPLDKLPILQLSLRNPAVLTTLK